jgi:hypothetical protein
MDIYTNTDSHGNIYTDTCANFYGYPKYLTDSNSSSYRDCDTNSNSNVFDAGGTSLFTLWRRS